MRMKSRRTYNGKIRLAVFDWAGTTVDFGCQAPVAAFIAGFKAKGLDISPQTARGPMGMEKRDHIKAITAVPEVARAWRKIHGRPVTDSDIDEMYGEFVPHLLATLESNSGLIPGVARAAEALTEKAISIGSTTGYFKEAADIVAASAAKAGFTPMVSVSSSDVTHGRPYPWMIFKVMEACNICPPEAVVNIGDTELSVILDAFNVWNNQLVLSRRSNWNRGPGDGDRTHRHHPDAPGPWRKRGRTSRCTRFRFLVSRKCL